VVVLEKVTKTVIFNIDPVSDQWHRRLSKSGVVTWTFCSEFSSCARSCSYSVDCSPVSGLLAAGFDNPLELESIQLINFRRNLRAELNSGQIKMY
jgi:hypothetical protein